MQTPVKHARSVPLKAPVQTYLSLHRLHRYPPVRFFVFSLSYLYIKKPHQSPIIQRGDIQPVLFYDTPELISEILRSKLIFTIPLITTKKRIMFVIDVTEETKYNIDLYQTAITAFNHLSLFP